MRRLRLFKAAHLSHVRWNGQAPGTKTKEQIQMNEQTETLPATQPPLIHARISAVMGDIGAVGKLGKNKEQGYSFRSIDDFYDAIQPALVKHRVFITPTILEHVREQRTTKSGAVLMTMLTKVRFKLWTEDGSFVEADALGEGADSGDKSANKAAAGALKYLFMQVFAIRVTGENHDSETESPAYHNAKPSAPATATSVPVNKPTPRALTPDERKVRLLAAITDYLPEAIEVFREEALISAEQMPADISVETITAIPPESMVALIKQVKDRRVTADQIPGTEVPAAVQTGSVNSTNEKPGVGKNGKPFVKYGICITGQWHNTFSKSLRDKADGLVGKSVVFTATTNQYGSTLETIEEQK